VFGMFDTFDFDAFDSPNYPDGIRGPDEPSGCFWYFVGFCIAMMLFIGILKWMS